MASYALELLDRPGFFVCIPQSMGAATVMTFPTVDEAEQYRWHRDALVTMATRVVDPRCVR